MTKEQKKQLVQELVETFKQYPNFYIANTGGMTVAEVNTLRRACFQADVKVFFYNVSASYLTCTDTTIIGALRTWITVSGETDGHALKGQHILLLKSEPEVWIGLYGRASIAGMGGAISIKHL